MHNVRITPEKNWQICFRPQYVSNSLGSIKQLAAILVEGVSRKSPTQGIVLEENREFDARIHFVYASRGCSSAHVIFHDNDKDHPYVYIMAGDDLQKFFQGLHSGKIPMHPDGFDVRLTFVKRGTQVFATPVF